MTAIISKTWIIPPALYAKKPMAQKMISITAIRYSKLDMTMIVKSEKNLRINLYKGGMK